MLTFALLAATAVALWTTGQLGKAAHANPEVSVDDDPAWGPANAPVTIVEFSDYQCPYCKLFYDETLPQIRQTYEGQIRFVYRDFPLARIHPHSQKAAEASECADDQGRFWNYHDLLWANQTALDVDSLKAYAAQLGLDAATFDDCLDSGKNAQEVQNDYSDGVSYGVTGTPTFFINDVELKGANPFSVFQQAIEPLLEATPTPTPTPMPMPPAPGQMHHCPEAGKWSIATWSGEDAMPIADALAFCPEQVDAAYSINPDTQAWARYFRGRPEISNLTTLDDAQGVIALGAGASAASTAEDETLRAAAKGLLGCPQAGKWAISVWTGESGTPIDQAMTSCAEATVASAYWIDPHTQMWKRYFDGRPEISNLATLSNMQAVIALGEEVPVTSGIEGQVLLGPMCPVVQVGTPCPDQPFQATIVFWNAERTKRIRTFTTDEQGRFRVPLAPGDYYVDPQPAEPDHPFPAPIPQTVTVPPDHFAQITVQYDTGIR